MPHTDKRHPTPSDYRKLVLAKAQSLESGKWLVKAFEVTVTIGSAVLIAVLTGNRAGAIAGVATGLLSLLLLAVFRFTFFLFAGAHKLHCDLLDKYDEVAGTQEKIASTPATSVDVRRIMKRLAYVGSGQEGDIASRWRAAALEFAHYAITPRELVDFEMTGPQFQYVQWLELHEASLEDSDINPGITVEQLKQWANYQPS